jgi:quinol monooxygenase YgiN
MIILAGTIDVHPEDLATMLASVEKVTAGSRQEAGCLAYQFSQDVADPNRLCLFEIWADQAAIDAHFKEPHFVAHRERTGGLRQTRNLTRYTAEKIPA